LPKWEAYYRIEYTYDEDDNLVEVLALGMDDSNIWGDNRYLYTYTEGRITKLIWSGWSPSDQAWNDFYGFHYEYNTQNQLINTIQYRLYDQSEDWLARFAYIHDGGDKLLTFTLSIWNPVDEIWGPINRTNYIYDDVKNLIRRNKQREVADEWKDELQIKHTYNNDYAYQDLIIDGATQNIIFDGSSYEYRHMRVSDESSIWNSTLQEWRVISRTDYYYSSLLTNVENAALPQLHIFPNPAEDMITFDLENTASANVKLYDTQGKYIGTQSLQNNQLSVNQLDSGTYFYELFYEGEMFGGKFIVK